MKGGTHDSVNQISRSTSAYCLPLPTHHGWLAMSCNVTAPWQIVQKSFDLSMLPLLYRWMTDFVITLVDILTKLVNETFPPNASTVEHCLAVSAESMLTRILSQPDSCFGLCSLQIYCQSSRKAWLSHRMIFNQNKLSATGNSVTATLSLTDDWFPVVAGHVVEPDDRCC